MGVHGLWKLIESAGKPVPVESLESKVLAIDVSIWLHQLIKGYQNPSASNISNAYLIGLFMRVCKLLFTNIKPVFVFDGGVPQLKRKTMATRQQQKDKSVQAAQKLREQLLKNVLKQKAVSQVLEEIREQSSPKKNVPDIYELPPLLEAEDSVLDVQEMSSNSSEEDLKPIKMKFKDLHTIDVNSAEFKSLPADIRHDILTELKETRKQSSLRRIHKVPQNLRDFSKYQMSRLLKRRSVQVSLEEAETEMGGRTPSLADIEALLAEGGIDINPKLSKRIASDNVTRYVYAKDIEELSTPEESKKCLETLNVKQEKTSGTIYDSKIVIKEEIDDIDELSDNALIREVEAIEKMHECLRDENKEFITEDMFESESSSEGVVVDDVNFIKDNSGLSQEQILAIIKQQSVDRMNISNPLLENIASTSKEIVNLQVYSENAAVEVLDKSSSQHYKSISLKDKVSDVHKTYKESDENDMDFVDLKISKKILKSNQLKTLLPNTAAADNCLSSVVPPTSIFKNTRSLATESNLNSSSQVSQIVFSNVSLDSSSNESDEFIEVPPSLNLLTGFTENTLNSEGLYIEEQPFKDHIDNDIFDDIFLDENNVYTQVKIVRKENETIDSNVYIDGQKKTLKDQSPEKSFGLAANSLKINVSSFSPKKNHIHSKKSVIDEGEVMEDSSSQNSMQFSKSLYLSSETCKLDIQKYSETSENVNNPEAKPESCSKLITIEEKPKRKLNIKQLEKLQDILECNEREILLDKNREDQMGTSITDQMYQEAQELLRLFGVPYVVAPMEAEAQCAFMDSVGLTQGTITDDSDIWLFGGRKVYKNFFDQKKFVLEFQSNDIQKYFQLTRDHLVLLALLVGSDYTVGLSGVGPVTAMEILATFPPPKADCKDSHDVLISLNQFKEWWQTSSTTHSPLAKKLRNIELNEGFPSHAVVNAYLFPMVDDSREPFSWGNPDLSALRDYAENKFGWSRSRTDQILLPVINKLSKNTSQLNLHTFFGAIPNISAQREKMSKRVQLAVNRLEGSSDNSQPVQQRRRQPNSTRGRGRIGKTTVSGFTIREKESWRARGRNLMDNGYEQPFIHESVGKSPEVIPQREKDKLEALKRKQHAIETIKNKKRKGMKKLINIRQEKPEANLSESSSDNNN